MVPFRARHRNTSIEATKISGIAALGCGPMNVTFLDEGWFAGGLAIEGKSCVRREIDHQAVDYHRQVTSQGFALNVALSVVAYSLNCYVSQSIGSNLGYHVFLLHACAVSALVPGPPRRWWKQGYLSRPQPQHRQRPIGRWNVLG